MSGTNIFEKKWYGIQGVATGLPLKIHETKKGYIRVQTKKNGLWQSLTKDECDRLVKMHNEIIAVMKKSKSITEKDLADSMHNGSGA